MKVFNSSVRQVLGINIVALIQTTYFRSLSLFLSFPRNYVPKDGSQEYTTKAAFNRNNEANAGEKTKVSFVIIWKVNAWQEKNITMFADPAHSEPWNCLSHSKQLTMVRVRDSVDVFFLHCTAQSEQSMDIVHWTAGV